MQQSIFLLCVFAVTAYLAVTAWEDYKTCEVTRWKHLIGFVPASCISIMNWNNHDVIEYVMIVIFSILYVAIGYLGIYGVADGFAFANLVIFFGGIGGLAGIGFVIVCMIIASFSFMFSHMVRSLNKKTKLFCNVSGAYIPHILIGYLCVCLVVVIKII